MRLDELCGVLGKDILGKNEFIYLYICTRSGEHYIAIAPGELDNELDNLPI